MDNDQEAQVFDKTYYESKLYPMSVDTESFLSPVLLKHPIHLLFIYFADFFTKTWRPRVLGGGKQDWTTGRGDSQMMLNTDVSSSCLCVSFYIVYPHYGKLLCKLIIQIILFSSSSIPDVSCV